MKSLFEDWRQRALAPDRCVSLDLDAIVLRVRLAQKVVTAPVVVALGVRADGQKVVLDLELLTSEATTAWQGLLEGLSARGLRRPRLCVIDGNPGLRAAVESTWPGGAALHGPYAAESGTARPQACDRGAPDGLSRDRLRGDPRRPHGRPTGRLSVRGARARPRSSRVWKKRVRTC